MREDTEQLKEGNDTCALFKTYSAASVPFWLMDYLSFATFLIKPGQKKKIIIPKDTEWSLLYLHRVQIPNIISEPAACLYGQVADSKGQLDEAERLSEFESSDVNTVLPNIDIDQSTFVIYTEGAAMRLFFASKMPSKLKVSNYLPPTPVFFQKEFLEKFASEFARIIKSDKPLHLLVWFLESIPQPKYFDDPQYPFPSTITSHINLLCKKIGDKILSELLSLLHFIDLSLSLGNPMLQSTAGVILALANEFPHVFEQVVSTIVSLTNTITFIAVLSDLNKRYLLLKILGSNFDSRLAYDVDSLYYLFSYTSRYKLKVHYNLFFLYSRIASLEELRLLYRRDEVLGVPASTVPRNKLSLNDPIDFNQNETNKILLCLSNPTSITFKRNNIVSCSRVQEFSYNYEVELETSSDFEAISSAMEKANENSLIDQEKTEEVEERSSTVCERAVFSFSVIILVALLIYVLYFHNINWLA